MSGTLYRDAALADGRSPSLQLGVSILVRDGHIAWIRPSDAEDDPGDAEVVDAGGATVVPGMIDCHSHLTLPGGSHWIDRGSDEPEQLLRHAEHNAKLQTHAGDFLIELEKREKSAEIMAGLTAARVRQ